MRTRNDARRSASLTETEVVAFVLLDLALIVALARIVGWAFVKLDQPGVIGEIIAGPLLGPTVLSGSVASGDDDGLGIVGELFPLEAVRVRFAPALR